MILEIEFTRIYDLNASLIHYRCPDTYEVDYTGKTECVNRLQYSEYELMKHVVEPDEGEFRVYQRILDFCEMTETRE
jgi:hypothetical protein